MEKHKTKLSIIMKEFFPGERFPKNVLMQIGKKITNNKDGKETIDVKEKEDVVSFLTGKGSKKLLDFQPPAKALIVAKSRPFEEWPIYQASKIFQEYIYGLPHNQLSIPGTSKSEHKLWLEKIGLNIGTYKDVQGLNLIFRHTKNIYEGVIKKVENKNKKNKEKIEIKNKFEKEHGFLLTPFEEETAFDDNGKLKNPPGINNSIYCYSQVSPEATKSTTKLDNVPSIYLGYYRDIDTNIKIEYINRLSIPKGDPGYIPLWQHELLSKKENNTRRQRKWYSNNRMKRVKRKGVSKYSDEQINQARLQDAILGKISIGEDWVLFDMRGLLRNLHWRKLVPSQGFSPKEILEQFTGDPVIDPVRNVITFIYKDGLAHKEEIVLTKKAPDLLCKLTLNNPIGIVSIDVGQTHPQSAKFSLLKLEDDKLVAECKDRQFLPDYLLNKLFAYRERSDQLRGEINQLAMQSLSEEHQKEFNDLKIENDPTAVRIRIEKQLGIDFNNLPINDMIYDRTTYIADAYLSIPGVDKLLVMLGTSSKKKYDSRIVKDFFKKVSKEAREALKVAFGEIQKLHPGYKKLSKSLQQWARECVNFTHKYANKITGCTNIVFVIENLKNIRKRNGSGKRAKGYDNFFVYKKENRWVMNALQKAYIDLATHKGINIIEIQAARTSITCPKCNCQDKNNRKGDQFNCVKCNHQANTDLEIATDNIELVALNGKGMPKIDCERSSGEENAVGARKGKKTRKIKEIQETDKNIKMDNAGGDLLKNNRSQTAA
jgi:hypothetical protein